MYALIRLSLNFVELLITLLDHDYATVFYFRMYSREVIDFPDFTKKTNIGVSSWILFK